MINLQYMVILLPLPIITFIPFFINQVHGTTNDSILIYRGANEVRNIDGDLNTNEWNNSARINFPEASLDEQNVAVYLGHESNNKALGGGFTIPGKSPVGFPSPPVEAIRFAL